MKFRLSWSAIKADFNMNSVTEVYFWKSGWETFDPHDYRVPVSLYYYLYRFMYMAWFVGATIHNFTCNSGADNNLYFIYLTNLTFTLQLLYSVSFFLYISCKLLYQRRFPNETISGNDKHLSNNNNDGTLPFHEQRYRLPLHCKLLWIMHNILNVVPYIVTLIYWLFLFGELKNDSPCKVAVNILTHGLNSPMALLEALVVAIPIRRSHVVFPMIAGVGYATFSGLYELFGGEYSEGRDFIYPMLDWRNKPGAALGTALGFIFVGAVLLHFLTSWGVYRLRLFLKFKCSQRSNSYVVDKVGTENVAFEKGSYYQA